MPKFQDMRDRLPSLYRPDDDDSAGMGLPLRITDIAEIQLDPALPPTSSHAGDLVIVRLPTSSALRGVRMKAGVAPGNGYALEVYRLEAGRPVGLPLASAQVRDDLATLPEPLNLVRFGLRLKRASLLTLLLRSVASRLDTADADMTLLLQSHWYAFADRAMYSPYVAVGRQRRGLPPLRAAVSAIQDPVRLITRLQQADDPVAQFIREQLSTSAQQAIDAFSGVGAPPAELVSLLAAALDTIVQSETLYNPERFAQVTLPPDVQKFMGQQLSGNELARFNWMLLDAAYPRELAQNVFDLPFIHDLGRLGALLALPPWREPASARESVEAYRERIANVVALYREGLGTIGSLRRMITAQLPLALDLPDERRNRPLVVEEFAPLLASTLAVRAAGAPLDMVGPMMRWQVENDGLAPAVPTLYIQGVVSQPDTIDTTSNPLIELYQDRQRMHQIGICYRGDLAPNQTLRIQPASTSWLGGDDGVYAASTPPKEILHLAARAAGPWVKVQNGPKNIAVAFHQSPDRMLWVAVDTGTKGQLWRFDGTQWTNVLKNLPRPHCLAENGSELLIGTASGLHRMQLYPTDATFTTTTDPAFDGQAVFTMLRCNDDRLLVGTANGATVLAGEPLLLQGIAVTTIAEDRAGTLHFGTAQGLLAYQPGLEHWYVYNGRAIGDQALDWAQLKPEQLAAAGAIDPSALPGVRCVRRGSDAALWVGTDVGLARYLARSVGGLSYETVLEAFPDLIDGPVFTITEDEHGQLWFGTSRGLFRYDGRDMWQHQADGWVQLGRADQMYDPATGVQPRGSWSFDRSGGGWQRLEGQSLVGQLRSTNESAVHAIAWTDLAVADLGSWDGTNFTHTADISEPLLMRYKPDQIRVLSGGIPSVPRLPVGVSTWRYLALVTEDPPVELRPIWTREGILFQSPADPATPDSGRYDLVTPVHNDFDQAIFAFNPAARVWFSWEAQRPLTLLAQLFQGDDEQIDPVILDRVWRGMQQVRPAGVRTALAVNEQIVRR